MKVLFILNDPPYGTERSYNALRLARNMLKKAEGGIELRVFLMGDASACAKAGQRCRPASTTSATCSAW